MKKCKENKENTLNQHTIKNLIDNSAIDIQRFFKKLDDRYTIFKKRCLKKITETDIQSKTQTQKKRKKRKKNNRKKYTESTTQ